MKKLLYKISFLLLGIAPCSYGQINSTPAVVPFNSNPGYGVNATMPTNLPTSGTYGKSQDAANAYLEWKTSYVEECPGRGFRVKGDEPNRTVSEGIAYGMLLSVYAADKVLFDGLWQYYKANSNGNGFMNWRIDGCSGVSGQNGATDADLDAAYALLLAENQWPAINTPYDYGAQATTLMNQIRTLEMLNGQAINGDGWGFGNDCRNPSYQSPAYYKQFAISNPGNAAIWNGAVSSAYTMLKANADPTTGLVSDWSNPAGVRNTCNPAGLGNQATDGFGYDAVRNPWRMMQDVLWYNDAEAKALTTKMATYVNSRNGNVGGPLFQNGNNYSTGYVSNAAFVSMLSLPAMASTNQALVNSMYTKTVNTKDRIQNVTLSGYYGNTLRVLSLFAFTGNMWKVGTTSNEEINVRVGNANTLSGTTFDFQNVQINTTKEVVFTIENLGFATLTLGPAPVVTVAGTGFTLQGGQPTATTLGLGASTAFTVRFAPGTTQGAATGTITIKSNDADEASYVISLTAVGTLNATAPKMIIADTTTVVADGAVVNMGTFTTSSRGYKVFKISNEGDGPLNITGATFTGTGFTLVDPASLTAPLIIAPGAKAFVTLGFTAPGTAVNRTGAVTFATNDPNGAAFVINLSASSAACGPVLAASKILIDYDGNRNVVSPFAPKGAFVTNTPNPVKTGVNISPMVASYVRPAEGDGLEWDGNYDIIRYYNCGSSAASTGAGLTSFGISVDNPAITMLVYSPAVGVEITLGPQKPGTTAGTWLPLIADYSSNVTRTTTKANQWELITFDMSKIIAAGVTADFKVLDIQIDPTLKYAGLAANAAAAARTFYIDDIRLGINPCVNDLSGILQDFENHNNVSLEYAVTALSAPILNPVSGGLNTSPNVGRLRKVKNTATYDDGFRYVGCSNLIDLSTKKYISMLVYSPVAGANVQISAKGPDVAVETPLDDTYPDDLASNTQQTVFANKWHRLYFDLSGVPAASLDQVFAIDINFDPNDLIAGTNNFYFDDIRFESELPCIAGIPATRILNDFDDNRYLNIAFPGIAPVAPSLTSFNPIAANTVLTGNPSATVGSFVRGRGTDGSSVRFTACQNAIDLTAGNTLINLKVLSPNAGVKVIMSLKNAAGTEVTAATETVATANAWTDLKFDLTDALSNTTVTSIDVIIDGDATFSGTASTTAQRTYLIDDLRYASPAPEINVKINSATTSTNVASGNSPAYSLGAVLLGDSSASVTILVQNNGLQSLNLTGVEPVVVGGTNAAAFVVTKTQTFTPSISALGATSFTVKFKPTVAGVNTGTITLRSNDTNEAIYVINLTGRGCVKASAGPNILGSTNNIQLAGTPAGGTWSLVTSPTGGGPSVYTPGAASAMTLAKVNVLGNYVFRYTLPASSPCPGSSDDVSVTVSTITSLEEELFNANVYIYPNPVSDKLTVNLNGVDATVTLLDVRGNVLFSGNSSVTSISMKEHAAGLYFVKINTGGKVFTQKITKN